MHRLMKKQELPKQWNHWCRSAKLKPAYGGRQEHERFYLRGRGRMWRVNNKGNFQCGDTYADFDRWALCKITECPLPTTRKDFIAAVKDLLKQQA